MSGLTIRGASDDLVVLEGVCDLVTKCPTCGHEYELSIGGRVGYGVEEIGCFDSTVTITIGVLEADVAVATIRFGEDGWKYYLDAHRAPWGALVRSEDGIRIDAPDGTPVRWEVSR